MISIIICDNDTEQLNNTKQLVSEYLCHSSWGDMPINIKTSSSPFEVISMSSEFQPDILILDIHMPEKNGFEIAETFHDKNLQTKIIFLTNYEQFVFYSLRFSPFRFIRKEKMSEELPEAIDSAIRSLSSSPKSLIVNKYSDYEVIPLNNIKYIEKIKLKNLVKIICANRAIEYGDTIQSLEKKLEDGGFSKINSGTLVNLRFVIRLSKQQIVLTDGTVLNVSLSRLDTFKKEFLLYQRFNF